MKNANMNLTTAVSTIDEISKLKAEELNRKELNDLVSALSVTNATDGSDAAYPIVRSALRFDGSTTRSRFCRTAVLLTADNISVQTFINGEEIPRKSTLSLRDTKEGFYKFLDFKRISVTDSIGDFQSYEYNNRYVNTHFPINNDISDIIKRLNCIISKGKKYFEVYPDDFKNPFVHLIHLVHDIYRMYDRLTPEEIKKVINVLNQVYSVGKAKDDSLSPFRFLCKAAAFELSNGKPLSVDAIHCTVNGEALYVFDFLRDTYGILEGVMYIIRSLDQEKK